MTDSVAKRGRPKLPKVPKMSCLKRNSDPNDKGFMFDNTIWHKNADSFRGLKVEKKSEKSPIILGEEEIQKQNERWRTHNDIVLLESDKSMIYKNEWISDSIVNASQTLLQRQYPEIKGLQNVLLCEISANTQIDWNKYSEYQTENKRLTELKRTAIRNIETYHRKRNTAQTEEVLENAEKGLALNEELNKKYDQELSELEKYKTKVEGLQPLEKNSKFVQILLDRTFNRSHWVCVSNLRTKAFKTLRIYDSDLERIHYSIENYSVYLKNSLKSLFSNSEEIRIQLPLVSQSKDNSSGGVYAIAFAQSLCAGLDPSDILFSNSPKEMRSSLTQFLEMATFDRFPTAKLSLIRSFDIWRTDPKHRKKKQKPKT